MLCGSNGKDVWFVGIQTHQENEFVHSTEAKRNIITCLL